MIMNPIKLAARNRYNREGDKAEKNRVNLEWFRDKLNLGDCLSPVVCEYMLAKKGLSFDTEVSRTKHLMAIGSVLGGRGDFDATVWGSGIMNFSGVCGVYRRKLYQKLDIRAVRGPATRLALRQCGITCPEVYGDPAVLMPLIFPCRREEKPEGTLVVPHYLDPSVENSSGFDFVDIRTEDYRSFIQRLCASEKVISSSLHGIILAESYGVPALFWNHNRDIEMMKYLDWYYSTGRMNVRMISSLEEALETEPMPLPRIDEMQKNLITSFPYDLWER